MGAEAKEPEPCFAELKERFVIEAKEVFNFVSGMGLGGTLVIAMHFLEKCSILWFKKNDLKLDITLGKALLEIREKIKKQDDK